MLSFQTLDATHSRPAYSCALNAEAPLLQVFVEYVMLANVNDGTEQAHQLGALLQGRAVVLNLMPWNPVYSPEFDFKAPGHDRTHNFQRIVREYGVHCTVRQEKGQDISGRWCFS